MSQDFDFAILSREDRGHWLASEMKLAGRSVAMVDCSSKLGRWSSDDLEGPFGVMRSPGLSAKQWGKTTEGIGLRAAEAGFVVWLRNKPIELKNANFNYLKSVHNELSLAENYFMEADGASPREVQLINEKIDLKRFGENWLIQLGHNFAANVQLPNAQSIRPKRPFPLFYNYFHRDSSRFTRTESFQRLAESGVKLFGDAGLVDITMSPKKQVEQIQVQTSHSTELIRAKHWIVLLSEEEIEFLNSSFSLKLSSGSPIKPTWSWVRYRMKFEQQQLLDVIPEQSLLIGDLKLPWSHDNFIQCIKSGKNEFDYWVKIPQIERFRKEYLDDMSRKILSAFKKRVPGTELKKVDMPAEYIYSFEELGPSPFACYDDSELNKRKRQWPKNWIADGPEEQNRLDLGYRLMRQQQKLKEWLDLGANSDRTIHSSGDGKSLEF